MLPSAPAQDQAQRRGIDPRVTIPSRHGRRLQADSPYPPWCSDQGRRVATGSSLAALDGSCHSADKRSRSSTFLGPFAPPALPGFAATMDPLTPAGRLLASVTMNTVLIPTGLLASCPVPADPSVANHLSSSGGSGLVLTNRLTVAAPVGSLSLADRASGASPFPSRLATMTGRIAFVMILRTGRSPPVAPHPASRRRSYVRLRSSDPTSTRTCTTPTQNTCKRTSALTMFYWQVQAAALSWEKWINFSPGWTPR
jgi:hypothetical protein